MSADAPKVEIDTGKLDALFAPFDRGDQPGLAVGVAQAGRPVYRRGFGLASVELPMVLTPTIRMRIGSTTKHFCALAIMLLAEEGKLSPEDSPRRVLPELPRWADAITLRQLMSHTSGMHCSLELIALTCGLGHPTPPDAQLKLLAGLDDVNFAPGTSYSYCNGGYVLLSEIVARVSGKPFSDFLQERILRLVGMHDTKLRPRDTDLLPNSATLHVARQEGGFSRGVFGVAIEGEGGLVSTIDDMLLWLAHMKNPVAPASARSQDGSPPRRTNLPGYRPPKTDQPTLWHRLDPATQRPYFSTARRKQSNANDHRAIPFQRTAPRKHFAWLVPNTSGRSNQKYIAT